jgi:hypothetical protein
MNVNSAFDRSKKYKVIKLPETVRWVVFISTVFFFGSCLGPKSINKMVREKYSAPTTPQKKKQDQISINSELKWPDNDISKTEKKTSAMLPLIVYWQFDYKNTCTLNPRIPLDIFNTTVHSYAAHGLRQKLQGRRLEINVKQIPTTFAIDDKGHTILFLVSWDNISIVPENKDLAVSYQLLDSNGLDVKNGELILSAFEKPIDLKMFQSLKKKTWAYLDQYDAEIAIMTKKLMDKLAAEL